MHLVIMVFRTSLEDEVLPWLDAERLAYTRLDSVQGKGATGTVPGSVTWGGANTLLLVTITDDQLNGFRDRAIYLHAQLESRTETGVPFHLFALPCTQWF